LGPYVHIIENTTAVAVDMFYRAHTITLRLFVVLQEKIPMTSSTWISACAHHYYG